LFSGSYFFNSLKIVISHIAASWYYLFDK